jgi:hypothetical protein
MTETVQETRATEPMVIRGCYFLDPIDRYLISCALRALRPIPTRQVQAILDRLAPTEEEKATDAEFIRRKIAGE